jgi:hypothetical protein
MPGVLRLHHCRDREGYEIPIGRHGDLGHGYQIIVVPGHQTPVLPGQGGGDEKQKAKDRDWPNHEKLRLLGLAGFDIFFTPNLPVPYTTPQGNRVQASERKPSA